MEDSGEEGNTKRPLVTTLHKQEDKQRKFTAYVAVQCRIGKKTDLFPPSPSKIASTMPLHDDIQKILHLV